MSAWILYLIVAFITYVGMKLAHLAFDKQYPGWDIICLLTMINAFTLIAVQFLFISGYDL